MPSTAVAAADVSAKRAAILDAAYATFTQYGFRRTSMDDIARAASVSRPTLYTVFKNKEDIFRGLAQHLMDAALARAAEAATVVNGTLTDRLYGVFEAKLGAFYDVVHGSAHAEELLAENSRIAADIVADARRRYERIVQSVLKDAEADGALDLDRVDLRIGEAATLCIDASIGLERQGEEAPTPAQYHKRLRQLVRVMVAGLGGA